MELELFSFVIILIVALLVERARPQVEIIEDKNANPVDDYPSETSIPDEISSQASPVFLTFVVPAGQDSIQALSSEEISVGEIPVSTR